MNGPPFALMIAGPNGSGKTTLTEELRRRRIDLGVYINPDEIAETLRGSYEQRVRSAQSEADRRRADCLDNRASFSFETVMSHPSKIEVLRRARELGFCTVLYFIATESPDLNVERVRQRVALGGHPVPIERIVARYNRALALLPGAIRQADRVVLFDNSYRAAPGKPVVLRPFLDLDQSGPMTLRIEPPVPGWGREAVQYATSVAQGPSPTQDG